jgi:hypothetical protein
MFSLAVCKRVPFVSAHPTHPPAGPQQAAVTGAAGVASQTLTDFAIGIGAGLGFERLDQAPIVDLLAGTGAAIAYLPFERP